MNISLTPDARRLKRALSPVGACLQANVANTQLCRFVCKQAPTAVLGLASSVRPQAAHGVCL